MTFFSRTFFLFVVAAAAMASISGCALTGKKDISPGQSRELHLFEPASHVGVRKIGEAEALRLAEKLSPRHQGLRSWQDISFAVDQSLAHAKGRPGTSVAFEQPGLTLTYAELADTLDHLKTLLPRMLPELLASRFTWYRIGPDFGMTGYYEPTLHASRTRSDQYPYPLYRLPKDVRKGVPYHTRHAIDRKGALNGRGLEIAWVSSETDAFFLHIQGSGRLRFPDGSVTHVLYAGKNNRAYKALGRIMRDEGLLEPDNISMNSIRETLERHPHRRAELFDKNPSYVFFREASKGPVGAMGRPLTPYVSTAADRKVLPHGSLTFLITPLPDSTGAPARPFYGLTLPQDTGGAIKGNRVDLFCGPGEEAEHIAGYLDARGAVYLLVKK